MSGARHLGQLPLPLGEGWGEGRGVHSAFNLPQPLVKRIPTHAQPSRQMRNIPPGSLQLPVQRFNIIQIQPQRRRTLHRLHLQIHKKIIRQMLQPHRLLLSHRQRHLHHTTDLTQIPRPRMPAQTIQHLLTQPRPLRRLTMLLPQSFKQRLLVTALAQWRQFQRQSTNAVIQILTKPPQLHLFAQRTVSRRNNPQIHRKQFAAAHRLHATLLQHPQ